jgi:hypothetical protein
MQDNYGEIYQISKYLAGALGLLELMGSFERCLFLDVPSIL